MRGPGNTGRFYWYAMRQVIITGSRHWTDRAAIWDALDRCDVELLIHGAARGADAIAHDWAVSSGTPVVTMPAAWQALGKAAGCVRNGWMLRFFPEAIVLAFPLNGPGTKDCIAQARALGREMYVYGE
jgi:hypothetical protein